MTPESITTGVKRHKGKIAGYGTASVLAGIIFFFWNLGVSQTDIGNLPETNRRVELLWDERPQVAAELRQSIKRIDSLIIVLGFTNRLLEKVTEKLEKER